AAIAADAGAPGRAASSRINPIERDIGDSGGRVAAQLPSAPGVAPVPERTGPLTQRRGHGQVSLETCASVALRKHTGIDAARSPPSAMPTAAQRLRSTGTPRNARSTPFAHRTFRRR